MSIQNTFLVRDSILGGRMQHDDMSPDVRPNTRLSGEMHTVTQKRYVTRYVCRDKSPLNQEL